MGIICSIHLVLENDFEKIPSTFQAVDDFLNKNSPVVEENGEHFFYNRHDTDKAWNPTFELLNKISGSNKDLFIHNDNKIDNLEFYYHSPESVFLIADKLSKIDSNTILDWISKKEIKEQIKSRTGYRMDAIDFPIVISNHFETIKKAFLDAASSGRSVVLSFG